MASDIRLITSCESTFSSAAPSARSVGVDDELHQPAGVADDPGSGHRGDLRDRFAGHLHRATS